MPQIFPCGQWITQAWHPLVIQIAELTGPWGVTALLMMVNGAIYDRLDESASRENPCDLGRGDSRGRLVFGAVRMRQIDELVAQRRG